MKLPTVQDARLTVLTQTVPEKGKLKNPSTSFIQKQDKTCSQNVRRGGW